MNRSFRCFSGIVQLSALLLLPVSLTHAQTELHPQVGDQNTYFPITLTLADTGSTGNMATWDFSLALYEPNDPVSYTFRLPSPNELTLHPEVTVVEEGSNGVKRLLRDSVTFLKQYQYVNPQATVFTYSQPATMFTFPIQYGTTVNTTAEVSYLGGVQLDVVETTIASVTGFGTLLTPLETFSNVKKVMYHHTREYYNADTLVTTLHIVESKWVSESENAVILSLQWNDMNNLTVASFRSESTSVALSEEKLTKILIYPNPASSSVQLSEPVEGYWLIDNAGRTVLTGKGSIIDLNGIANGNYRLQFEQNGVLLNRSLQVNN